MALFIISMVLFGVAVIALLAAIFTKSGVAGFVTAGSVVLGAILLFFATFYQNGEGEAKVMVNSVDRTVQGEIIQPGSGFKPAWVDFVDFDLFSQEAVYAGGSTAPSYTGGTVNGSEITISVGGLSGGSTQGNMDATFVYSLDTDKIEDIYREFKSQERFTKMIIEKQILSVARQVPSNYSATEFRGMARGEAEVKMMELLNERLGKWGVEFSQPTIQDVRYPETVEAALVQVEEANQKQQRAEADLRASEVAAQQKVVEAKAEADANAILSQSLTPQVLEQRRIDALLEAAKSGNLIITDGTNSANVLIQP